MNQNVQPHSGAWVTFTYASFLGSAFLVGVGIFFLPWKRADGKDQDLESSDGYGTGYVIHLARLSGIPASDERLAKGVQWLKTHQRDSGRWFTRSLNKDGRSFLTHAGTAFALSALHACGELK